MNEEGLQRYGKISKIPSENGTYIMVYMAQGSVRKKGTKYKAQSVLIICGNVLQSHCEF